MKNPRKWEILGGSVKGGLHKVANLPNQDSISWRLAKEAKEAKEAENAETEEFLEFADFVDILEQLEDSNDWDDLEQLQNVKDARNAQIAQNTENMASIEIMPATLAVSDGHGGAKYIRSADGSKWAVVALKSVVAELPIGYFSANMGNNELEELARQIKRRFLHKWQTLIGLNQENTPFSAEELNFFAEKVQTGKLKQADVDKVLANPKTAYGCTFLGAVACHDLVLLLQYGDGDILGLYGDGTTEHLILPDARNVGNTTLSLCNLTNATEIQHRFLLAEEIPQLIMLCTDGVVNSFPDNVARENDGFFRIPVQLKNMLKRENANIRTATEILKQNFLEPMANAGSGDDTTMGVLFDFAALLDEEVEKGEKGEEDENSQKIEKNEENEKNIKKNEDFANLKEPKEGTKI